MIQEICELSNVIVFDGVIGWTRSVCCNGLDGRNNKFGISPVDELAVMAVLKLDIESSLSQANDTGGVRIVLGARVDAFHAITDAENISR
jgi:hypothetical protein